jgi:hypothetical protein
MYVQYRVPRLSGHYMRDKGCVSNFVWADCREARAEVITFLDSHIEAGGRLEFFRAGLRCNNGMEWEKAIRVAT